MGKLGKSCTKHHKGVQTPDGLTYGKCGRGRMWPGYGSSAESGPQESERGEA